MLRVTGDGGVGRLFRLMVWLVGLMVLWAFGMYVLCFFLRMPR